MIAYLDASALVKRYVAEAGSAEVGGLVSQAEAVGTAISQSAVLTDNRGFVRPFSLPAEKRA
jgi:predicted nucleic acid-binding protein